MLCVALAGCSPSSMYPFSLHDKINLPWDYAVMNGVMTLHARACERVLGDSICNACWNLASNNVLWRIELRAAEGVHENANHTYNGFGGLVEIQRRKNIQIEALQLHGLNNVCRLIGQVASLTYHKQFVVAIASGRYEQVDHLVHVALGQKRKI